MKPAVHLIGIGTALPPHVLPQPEIAVVARRLFGSRFRDFDRMAEVFASAGIRTRHSVRPIDWFLQPQNWAERTAAYLEGAKPLFIAAAGRALAMAGLSAADVDTVVTISSTGIATPSLDARVSAEIGFRPDIRRVPVFGLGCAGGVTGLALAARLARAEPDSVVLVVAVELCTLAFRLDELTKANIVATALFGDGAAACVLRTGPSAGASLATVESSGEHTWPDTLDIMGWDVDPSGFKVIFAKSIPPFAEAHIAPALHGILARAGLRPGDIDRYLCHPGGSKVIAALEQSLSLRSGSLDHERAVLAENGNMSAPTILFVLERAIRAGLPARTALLSLGPGFTLSCLTLTPGGPP